MSRQKTARAARRLFRLCLVDGRLDPARVRQAAGAIARSGRRPALGILAELHRLVRLERARHTATVESAVPLTPDLREAVQSRLSRVYGGGLDTSFGENAALIGGMRIRVGSDVYDGSVRARLDKLHATL